MELFTSWTTIPVASQIIVYIYINIFVSTSSLFGHVVGFNIFEEQVDMFSGGDVTGSLFGYTVLQHENSAGKWILVGAPKSRSVYQRTPEKPGALYKCPINDRRDSTQTPAPMQRCEQVTLDTEGNVEHIIDGERVRELKDDQWLGVSLDSKQNNGDVVVCGHRWVNNYDGYYRKTYEYPHGLCYTIDSDLRQSSIKELIPCLKGDKIRSGTAWYGWCQAGTSAHYTSDGTLLLGAPGAIGWRGTVISMANGEPQIAGWSTWFPSGETEQGYVGYSITSGSFTSPTAKEGATGAPRAYEFGKVFIFDVSNFAVKMEIYGEPMNTYFGSSVAAVDLNNDGLSDLLVGAPLYTDKMDEGRVYVYMNQGEGNLQLMNPKLQGNNAIGGRFGTSIAAVGDLNQDGYQDIAIGAPFEDNKSGAVYIYRGSPLGIKSQFAQRLAGKAVYMGITSFGSSISGGMDMDGNGYPDVVVGAHQNATVVYYRTQPVLTVENSLQLTPEVLDPYNRGNTTLCKLGGRSVTCISIKLCLRYTGHRVPATRDFTYTLKADILRTDHGLSSRFYFSVAGAVSDQIMETMTFNMGRESCTEHNAYVKTDVRDLLNTIPFQSKHSLHSNSRLHPSSGLPLVFNQDFPNTVIREAAFVRECGNNGICETDMNVSSDLQTTRGIQVMYLGDPSNVIMDVNVTNNGEEAHQARLTVSSPPNAIYIGFEPILGGMFPCDPVEYSDDLQCRLGNPMQSNSMLHFKLRFDVSSVVSTKDTLNFTVAVHTSSVEANETLSDNVAEPVIPILVLADVVMRGASNPEQVVYETARKADTGSSGVQPSLEDIKLMVNELENHNQSIGLGVPSSQGEDALSTEELGNRIGISNSSSVLEEAVTEVESTIGPSVVFTYEVRNLGPSYIPYSSFVNIRIPWRLKNGDWLLYLTGIRAVEGIQACNIREVLLEQSVNLKAHYELDEAPSSSTDGSSTDGGELPHESGVYKLDCSSASCVTVTCHIQHLRVLDSVVIKLHTLLWKYSFVQHSLGVSDLTSEASITVDDPTQKFTQPDQHMSDEIQLTTTVTAAILNQGVGSIPPWIVIVSILAGLVLLVLMVFVMSKFGFFRRISKDDMQKMLDEKESQNTEYQQGLNGDTKTEIQE